MASLVDEVPVVRDAENLSSATTAAKTHTDLLVETCNQNSQCAKTALAIRLL